MKILEISKKYLREFYNNNIQKIIEEKDGIIFNDYTIKQTFKNGHGTVKDLKQFIENNRAYCHYYDLINKKFI